MRHHNLFFQKQQNLKSQKSVSKSWCFTKAMLLADMGLTEKARRYMVLLQAHGGTKPCSTAAPNRAPRNGSFHGQAFVKAVPQNRLSDAFRSSMREFNEVPIS